MPTKKKKLQQETAVVVVFYITYKIYELAEFATLYSTVQSDNLLEHSCCASALSTNIYIFFYLPEKRCSNILQQKNLG